jgi:nucleoside-diphosphate-sugar epimerase
VFGPRQDPGSPHAAVIPRFGPRMLRGEPPVIFGSGRQTRDFTFVANAVQACVLPAAGPDDGGEVRQPVAVTSKAERVLGYRPLVTMRQGLGHTLRWLDARGTVRAVAAPE